MSVVKALWQRMRHCLLRTVHGQAASALPDNDGARAETLAADFLARQGVRVIARNVRFKGGEIDLIGDHQGTLVFVEVRLRKHADFGGAAASITASKQRRVVLASKVWLQGDGRRYAKRPMRFDALLLNDLKIENIEWIQGAFSAY
jgi:putative endonuclease